MQERMKEHYERRNHRKWYKEPKYPPSETIMSFDGIKTYRVLKSTIVGVLDGELYVNEGEQNEQN